MTVETNQASLPAQGTETETPAAQVAAVEPEATDLAAADTTESGDDSNTEGKDNAEAEVEKLRRKTQRRIDRLTAEKGAAQERIRTLEAAVEAKARAGEDDDTKPAAEDPREIAKQLVAAQETAKATARMMKDAKARFPEFEKNVAELVEEVGPLIDRKTGAPSPLMAAVFDSDAPTDVLNFLGENPEIAAELVGLSESKIGRRIAKIESDLAAAVKPKTSAAAKPLAPVKPSAAIVADPAKMTDAQWREADRKARMGR